MVGKLLFLFFTLVILLDPVFLDLFRNVMKPIGIKCFNNPKRIANFSCSLKARGRNDYIVNMEGDLPQPLRNFSARFEVFRFYNIYRPFIPNITEYYCEFMAGRKNSLILQIVSKHLRNTSTFNTTCPYMKRFIIREWHVMPEAFPSLFPQGKYKVKITIHDDTKKDPYVATLIGLFEILENVVKRIKQH